MYLYLDKMGNEITLVELMDCEHGGKLPTVPLIAGVKEFKAYKEALDKGTYLPLSKDCTLSKCKLYRNKVEQTDTLAKIVGIIYEKDTSSELLRIVKSMAIDINNKLFRFENRGDSYNESEVCKMYEYLYKVCVSSQSKE